MGCNWTGRRTCATFPLTPDRGAPPPPLGTRSRLGRHPERFLFCRHTDDATLARVPTSQPPNKPQVIGRRPERPTAPNGTATNSRRYTRRLRPAALLVVRREDLAIPDTNSSEPNTRTACPRRGLFLTGALASPRLSLMSVSPPHSADARNATPGGEPPERFGASTKRKRPR